jgi:hypothetical protein
LSVLGRLCARRLGLERSVAERLLARAHRDLGARGFSVRALAFVVAVVPPLSRVLPARARRRAVFAFVGPLLDAPAARNAYGAGRDALLEDPGRGLVR